MAGHTHSETYQLSNSMTNPEKPILLTSVGGSVTTYEFNNPSYMVIDFDAKTMLPINMKTWYIDVEEANRDGQPTWRELHDYTTTYALEDLSPSSMKDLAVRILTDKQLASEFMFNEKRQNIYSQYTVSQLNIFCDLATSEQHENHECNMTANMSAYGSDFKILSKDFGTAMVDRILGNWVKYSINKI